jgi:protein-S-isoprenylcysteine O-methyltransferase Ste14
MSTAFILGSSAWFPSVEFAEAFTAIYLVFILAETVNSFIGRSKRERRRDRDSYFVVVAGVIVMVMATFSLRGAGIGLVPEWVQLIGLVMMPAGILFREWAVFSLGRGFTVMVQIAKDHQLVKRGPYRWIRHPSYGGSLLTFAGAPLAIGTWAGAVAVIAVFLVTYSYRMRVEEQAMVSRFGDEYREYKKRTWKLLPGL